MPNAYLVVNPSVEEMLSSFFKDSMERYEKERKAEPGIRIHSMMDFGLKIISSPYLLMDVGGYAPPPSIIHDFDRWFINARSNAEQKQYNEWWRKEQILNSCWRE